MGTRDVIVDAAARVMHERGLARATTKEIAREAGFSEAALYKHFPAKTDLFLAVLKERMPGELLRDLGGLRTLAGTGSITERLVQVAAETISFYLATFPVAASLFSEQTLLATYRADLAGRGAGPHVPYEALADYLAAERDAGRLGGDPHAAARLLMGGCLQHAFLAHFSGTLPNPQTIAGWARALVATLTDGLQLTESPG